MRRVCFAVICCLILLFSNVPAKPKINRAAGERLCALRGFKATLRDSSAVFAGEVLSETKNGNEKTFEFRVKKYWKGKVEKKVKVTVVETMRFQAWFRVGESYLIFARADEKGQLRDGRCSMSQSLSAASGTLKKLGRAKIPR